MVQSRETARDIIVHNWGFSDPDRWVDFAIREGFAPVRATPIPLCPDCGGKCRRVVGTYVHFSTFIRLRECYQCGLIWSDARVEEALLKADFDHTYHEQADNSYFKDRRLPVFRHLAAMVDRAARAGGRVLDIGGAQGHLMDLVRRRRADLETWVHDISLAATRYAAEKFGLPVLCGDLSVLGQDVGQFDVVVMSDVIYYEKDLEGLWTLLPRLMAPGGTIIIRVPNKLILIRVGSFVDRLWNRLTGAVTGRLRFFNSAHSYVFSRRYLMRRIASIGFSDVAALPSPLLAPTSRVLAAASEALFKVINASSRIIRGGLVLTPSMLLTARWFRSGIAGDPVEPELAAAAPGESSTR